MNCNGLLNMFLCSEPLSGRFQLVKISNDVDDEEFATLTGAARVAVGTDLPALFCNNDKLAQKIIEFGLKHNDPVWRLPLWEGYKHLIESNVADLSSTGSTPFGGAITAALFLENFIEGDIPWAHIDLMAYNTRARPGRPEGGEAQAIRGLYAML